MNTVPSPTTLVTLTRPPWASTRLRTIDSPRPVPPESSAPRRVGPPEPLEYRGQIFGRDAVAGVGDPDPHGVVGGIRLEGHSAARVRVIERVGHQVVQDLTDAAAISSQGQVRLGVHGQFDPLGMCSTRVRLDDGSQQRGEIQLVVTQVQTTRVGDGQGLQVGDDSGELAGLAEQARVQRRVVAGDAVFGGLQPAEQVGQRGAQFVSDIAVQLHAQLLAHRSLPRHLVERHAQPGELVGSTHRHLHPDLALRDLLRRGVNDRRRRRMGMPIASVTPSTSNRMTTETRAMRPKLPGVRSRNPR